MESTFRMTREGDSIKVYIKTKKDREFTFVQSIENAPGEVGAWVIDTFRELLDDVDLFLTIRTELKKINNLADLARQCYGINPRQYVKGESLLAVVKKHVYKYTDCGAWISVIRDGVELGSIVEGSDAEIGPYLLPWGFTKKKFFDMLSQIEQEASDAWDEANTGADNVDRVPYDPATSHQDDSWQGTEGQDRESYSDTQDRESYKPEGGD